jgi:hypothetical protein
MKKTGQRSYALRGETIRMLTSQHLQRVTGGQTGIGRSTQPACTTAMCEEDGTTSTLDGGCYQTGNC